MVFYIFMKDKQKYILGQDNSCHWYILPAEKGDEWMEWLSIDEDDERSWAVPDFAKAIDGWHRLTFENPIEE